MKEKCIIYGGAGFIGSHITDILLENDYDVTVFDKINSSKKNIEHNLNKVNFIEGDFNNSIDIKETLKHHDYAIHLVSSTLPADSNKNPEYDVETNLVSSLNLFDECLRQKVKKIIFVSSGGTVYGNPLKLPIKEDHPTNPTSSYGIIKLTIEKYLYMYKVLKGLNYKILRFGNPFGERQNPLAPQGLISSLLFKIKNRQTIEIWGDGKIIRDYFYVKDGANAVLKALTDPSIYNIFNISGGKGYSVNKILEKFRKVLNLKFRVKYLEGRTFDVKKNILDISRAAKILKWMPETDFNEALRKTWRYIVENE